jgi:type II secretory pathway component PulF
MTQQLESIAEIIQRLEPIVAVVVAAVIFYIFCSSRGE